MTQRNSKHIVLARWFLDKKATKEGRVAQGGDGDMHEKSDTGHPDTLNSIMNFESTMLEIEPDHGEEP